MRRYVQVINTRTGERKPAFDVSYLTAEARWGFVLGVRQSLGYEWVVEEYEADQPRDHKPASTA